MFQYFVVSVGSTSITCTIISQNIQFRHICNYYTYHLDCAFLHVLNIKIYGNEDSDHPLCRVGNNIKLSLVSVSSTLTLFVGFTEIKTVPKLLLKCGSKQYSPTYTVINYLGFSSIARSKCIIRLQIYSNTFGSLIF